MEKLNEEFFARKSKKVAKELIGKRLVRISEGKRLEGIIAETGAFFGEGRDKENITGMYSAPGQMYIMKFRGLNFLNVGTSELGTPSVVHISGLWTPEKKLYYGPGQLTKILNIGHGFNGKPIISDELWIEDAGKEYSFNKRKQGLPKNCIAYYRIEF